jgi:hypothetical protein
MLIGLIPIHKVSIRLVSPGSGESPILNTYPVRTLEALSDSDSHGSRNLTADSDSVALAIMDFSILTNRLKPLYSKGQRLIGTR